MNEQDTKNNRVLLIFIAALLLILIGQASFLIFNLTKNASPDSAVFQQNDLRARETAPSAINKSTLAVLSPRAYRHQTGNSSAAGQRSFSNNDALLDPWLMFEKMHERMNNLFGSTLATSSLLAPGFDSSSSFDFAPAIDLEERPDAYVLRGDLPGLEKDKIDVTVRDNIVSVQGVRESGKETKDDDLGYFAQERSYGSFLRTVALPGPVDETKVAANYENGVLTISLPKRQNEGEGSKKISIA